MNKIILLLLLPALANSQMPKAPDPINNVANEKIQEARQGGSNLQVTVHHGAPAEFGNDNDSKIYFVELLKLPTDLYRNKQYKDSVFNANKFLYIEDALKQGCWKIRLFISKNGFMGGTTARTFAVTELLEERRKARQAINP